tara:strand:+ start:8343 stop:8897 length:555 start_codon:yes stop_codon:yes gene_type:complete
MNKKKDLIRKRFFLKRKKNYFEIKESFFAPLIDLIKKSKIIKKKHISLYYPNLFETNVLKILDLEFFKKFIFFLPVIEKKNSMSFYKWRKGDILFINKYGIPEPLKTKKIDPTIILVPLLAYDKNKNRLGYGKGFYDNYLNKLFNKRKKILSIGIAFSFQKYHKLPTNCKDFKLNYIITEKGIF